MQQSMVYGGESNIDDGPAASQLSPIAFSLLQLLPPAPPRGWRHCLRRGSDRHHCRFRHLRSFSLLGEGLLWQEAGESDNLSQPGVARGAEALQAIPCGSDPMDVGSSEVRLRLRVPLEQVEGGRMQLGQPPLVDRLLRHTADFKRVSQCMNRFIECPFRLSPEGVVERGSKVTGDVGGATRQSLFDLSHELAAHFLACLHAGESLLTKVRLKPRRNCDEWSRTLVPALRLHVVHRVPEREERPDLFLP